MYDEKDARLLYARAIKQYVATSTDISTEEKADAEKILEMLNQNKNPDRNWVGMLCNALGYYVKSLKSIEQFMISDPLFLGFDGSNPLLIALNKEISFTLEVKGHTCHDDFPKRPYSRIDW
ncbi:MAG TPA: hypothetical protein VJ695_00945 [Nitrososphaera sp.]|nr:hypothetical protein [Nitrososphaera sp.]